MSLCRGERDSLLRESRLSSVSFANIPRFIHKFVTKSSNSTVFWTENWAKLPSPPLNNNNNKGEGVGNIEDDRITARTTTVRDRVSSSESEFGQHSRTE